MISGRWSVLSIWLQMSHISCTCGKSKWLPCGLLHMWWYCRSHLSETFSDNDDLFCDNMMIFYSTCEPESHGRFILSMVCGYCWHLSAVNYKLWSLILDLTISKMRRLRGTRRDHVIRLPFKHDFNIIQGSGVSVGCGSCQTVGGSQLLLFRPASKSVAREGVNRWMKCLEVKRYINVVHSDCLDQASSSPPHPDDCHFYTD